MKKRSKQHNTPPPKKTPLPINQLWSLYISLVELICMAIGKFENNRMYVLKITEPFSRYRTIVASNTDYAILIVFVSEC